MCKKHDADGYKRILQEVMQRGYALIDACGVEYKDLNARPEAERDVNHEEHLRILMHLFRSINDVIHPGHVKALELFPAVNHPFIDNCSANHKVNREQGLSNKCSCCPPLQKKEEVVLEPVA